VLAIRLIRGGVRLPKVRVRLWAGGAVCILCHAGGMFARCLRDFTAKRHWHHIAVGVTARWRHSKASVTPH
jgi:hypothetical protein